MGTEGELVEQASLEHPRQPDPSSPEALRARYRAERDKRLRPEGVAQYLEPTGRFANFTADPYTAPAERAPLHREVEVAIIGAGFAGLCAGARLRQAGFEDLWMLDGAGDVGGAWYWNRYPGAMCDTAAMIYLPLLEATGTVPSAKYVPAREIFAHAKAIATTFDLYRNALFSTSVNALNWRDDLGRWEVRTDRGDVLLARFVAMGTGPLHRPKLPGISGIEDFEGHCFHTSRWDYGYTGGSSQGEPMDNLADKVVGIIGTGATGVQAIPHLAKAAGELYVFQRTPSSIDVRNNAPIDPEWFASLEPGWQGEWLTNFATLQTGGFTEVDLVDDGWTDIAKRIRDKVVEGLAVHGFDRAARRAAYEASDDEKMAEIRARVDALVQDPATAELLKPWYRQLCKRPCFHDEYLQSYNLPTVHLIDTGGRGVERADANGVFVGETHYRLDCLIFASGFEVGTDLARRAGFSTTGRGGVTLSQAWEDGMVSLHGMHVHGFPNLFLLGFSQAANLISNVTHNYVDSSATLAAILGHAKAIGAAQVEVTGAAQAAWVNQILEGEEPLLFDPDCTPGYYNNEGDLGDPRLRIQSGGYPEGSVAFFAFIEAWRTSGRFDGLTFSA